MKRPQSAKHGHKGIWAQMSSDDISDQQNLDNHYQHRKKVKIMKPDFTTNDFARLLPKKIHQDKQRLYSQALQLKQSLNQTIEENTRLKTKIAILQKQKDKMTKFIDSSDAVISNKPPSRLNIFPNKNTQKQNAMVRNLKKMIRQSKQQNEFLKQENAKIKKGIKYTKINQLEIEKKMILQQNQRLNTIMEQLNEQVNMQSDYEKQIRQLRRYLEQQVQNNKELSESNQSYIQYIQSLEEKAKNQEQKIHEKQKKLQRDLALAKRKLNEQIKIADQLRKQVRNIKQTSQLNDKKKNIQPKNNMRPTSSNPYYKRMNQASSLSQMPNKKEVQDLKDKNEKLQKQLQQIKSKLKTAQDTIIRKTKTQQQNKQPLIINSKKQNLKESDQPFIIQDKKQNIHNKLNQQLLNQQLLNQLKNQQQNYEEQNYQQQFEPIKAQKQTTPKKQSPSKNKIDVEIEKYKKDFTQEVQEQQIYQKQHSQAQDKTKAKKSQKSQKKGKKQKSSNYKPDKKILQSIKQLLTYRMKAQRYPFDQLQNDIKVSGQTKFQFVDLDNMLKNQPFYLTQYYSSALLKYIFENDKPNKKSNTSQQNLIKKLRKVIQTFQLPEEKQEQQMLLRIAEMTSTYPKELEAAFDKVKNGDGTLSKSNLVQMFQKLELADNYIELIISQLSLCSQDLDHLNYYGFFQRFYISEAQEQFNEGINMPIDQQQIESSGGSSRPIKKSVRKSNKIQKVDEEEDFEQQQPQFVLDNKDEKVQLSMGAKDNEPYLPDDDIVSDDGKV